MPGHAPFILIFSNIAEAQCRIHNSHISLNVIAIGILWLTGGCITAAEMLVFFEKDIFYFIIKEEQKISNISSMMEKFGIAVKLENTLLGSVLLLW